MKKHIKDKKSPEQIKTEKHTMDIYGDLIFHKKPHDADVEDVYHEPKVPGKFAGDC